MNYKKPLLQVRVLWIVAAIVSGCIGAPSEPYAAGDFSIYLVKQGVSAQQAMEMDLSQLELEKIPILSTDDIVAYAWKNTRLG